MKLQLEKPPAGGLGFSVIGGERGIFVKSITPGGTAEITGTLQVGDRLLKVYSQCFYTLHQFFFFKVALSKASFVGCVCVQVNDDLMIGVSHSKAVTTIRKAKGLVHLIVSRPPDQMPNTYLDFLPLKSNGVNGNNGMAYVLTTLWLFIK